MLTWAGCGMAGALPGGADALVQLSRCPRCDLRRMLSLVYAAHRSLNVVKKPGTRVLNVGSYVHFNIFAALFGLSRSGLGAERHLARYENVLQFRGRARPPSGWGEGQF